MGDARGRSSSPELPAGPTRSFSCLLEHHLWMTGMMQEGTNDLHCITWTQLFLHLACQPKPGTARDSLRPGLNLARATSRVNNL